MGHAQSKEPWVEARVSTEGLQAHLSYALVGHVSVKVYISSRSYDSLLIMS